MEKIDVKRVAAKKAKSKYKKLKVMSEVAVWVGELLSILHSRARVVDSIGKREYVQVLASTECVVHSIS